MGDAFGGATQPVVEPVGEFPGARLAGVDDDEIATDPDVTVAGPGQFDVRGHGPLNAHLTAHGRQAGPLQGGGDLLAQVGERLLVHPVVGAYPHRGGGLAGTDVLASGK